MGHGKTYFLRGIVTYLVSPFYLKADMISMHGVFNTVRRVREEALYVGAPLGTGYLIYYLVERRHEKLKRKNPKDYIHDQ
ncbi:cytochrome b-c1 complex subunit 8-like [Rhynchophorus ferrugineus]|uniref:Cytochrome b-c1 complex subunit 8 n=1 Tax=Rhynchophorus ferrugineus TaxID=354439 RepID=A0A834MNS6_RHYFE|nr:hypothetical protein GWI33_000045 [Rhynchophorus ferrugineus]